MSLYTFSTVCSLLLGLCLFIWQTSLAISLIKKLYLDRKDKDTGGKRHKTSFIRKSTQGSAITAFIFTAIAGLAIVIIHIYNASTESVSSRDSTIHATFHYIYLIFLALAYMTTYFFMLCRLYAIFEESVFRIKKWVICLHIGIVILTTILGFTFIILVYVGLDALIGNILFAIMVFITIFAIIHLVFAFNYRLFKLVLTQQSIIMDQSMGSLSLSGKQVKMLAVARRHTLLGVMMISLAFISIIDYAIAVSVNDGEYRIMSNYSVTQGYNVLFDIINVITLNLASLSIYLGFTVNKEYYVKICNKCDIKCKSLCETMAEKKINGDAARGENNMTVTYNTIKIMPQTPSDIATPTTSAEK